MPTSGAGPALNIGLIARALTESPLQYDLRYFPTLDSTNTCAMGLPLGEAYEGLIIITDYQTAGRGRVGRIWEGFARQQLTFSVILTPPFAANWLMMASALAVHEAITDVAGLTPAIKWPNDVLIGGKKVCGILIETSGEIAVIGIGVNVNGSLTQQPELAGRATTLEDVAGQSLSRETLAAAILISLAKHYETMRSQGEAGREAVRLAWRERLVTLGAKVRIDQGQAQVMGRAEDVTGDGALIVRQDDGARVVITWGDVHINN